MPRTDIVVKVQISLNDGGKHVLIYNQDRSFNEHFETTDNVRRLMGNRAKAYFSAAIVDMLDGSTELQIDSLVPDQDW